MSDAGQLGTLLSPSFGLSSPAAEVRDHGDDEATNKRGGGSHARRWANANAVDPVRR
jgi:hypothetical protein